MIWAGGRARRRKGELHSTEFTVLLDGSMYEAIILRTRMANGSADAVVSLARIQDKYIDFR